MTSKELHTTIKYWVFILVMALVAILFVLNSFSASERKEEMRSKDAEAQRVQSEKILAAEMYDKCIDGAYEDYNTQWNEAAAAQGSGDGKISNASAVLLDNRHKAAKEECARLYPLK